MKMLGAIWASFGCVLMVMLGGANADTIIYAGRSALLSYSPARGEFPVKSLIGRGYFSYIDQNGNSNIVSLEPNPLFGVRVGASGEPLDENGRIIVLGSLAKNMDDNSNKDRLKPIKEFDETPFVDSVDQKNVILPSTSLPDSKRDSLPSPPLPIPATDAGQQIFLYQLPRGAAMGRQVFANQQGAFNPTNPFLPPIFPESSAPATNHPKPSVFPSPPGNTGQNPFLLPNMGLVFSNPTPVISSGAVRPSTSDIAFANPFEDTSPNDVLPSITTQADIPEIVFPNSPLITGSSGLFLNPAPPEVSSTTTASPIADILSTPMAFPTSSPDLIYPNQNTFIPSGTTTSPLASDSPTIGVGNPFLPSQASVFPNPSAPPPSPTTSQGNLQNPLQPCTSPSIMSAGPQFIANNRNPFLPQRTNLNSQMPALNLADIEAITNNIDIKSSISGQAIFSPFGDDTAIPKQVTDTPEVEEAKREHFLAHELALAQLELAQQTSEKEYESSSPSLSVADSSSVYLPPDLASFQAVTSGPSTVVITEQTKLTGAESDTVS